MLITDQAAWEYLGFFEEPDPVTLRQIQRTARTAEMYLTGATGYQIRSENNDPRAVELGLMALGFLYDNRTLEGKGSGAVSMMKTTLMAQLKFEYERSMNQDNALSLADLEAVNDKINQLVKKQDAASQDAQEMAEKVEDLNQDLSKAKESLTNLETSQGDLAEDLSRVRNDVSKIKTDLTELQTDVSELQTDQQLTDTGLEAQKNWKNQVENGQTKVLVKV